MCHPCSNVWFATRYNRFPKCMHQIQLWFFAKPSSIFHDFFRVNYRRCHSNRMSNRISPRTIGYVLRFLPVHPGNNSKLNSQTNSESTPVGIKRPNSRLFQCNLRRILLIIFSTIYPHDSDTGISAMKNFVNENLMMSRMLWKTKHRICSHSYLQIVPQFFVVCSTLEISYCSTLLVSATISQTNDVHCCYIWQMATTTFNDCFLSAILTNFYNLVPIPF